MHLGQRALGRLAQSRTLGRRVRSWLYTAVAASVHLPMRMLHSVWVIPFSSLRVHLVWADRMHRIQWWPRTSVCI